uniref:alpha-1,2-Mannosidase n=1 Tax=Glossina brevipalpis TaxID=37001 RepID=A0A1A9W7Y5_9MUSC
MLERPDHVALNLSVTGVSSNDDISHGTTIPATRKSLRRSWNQLPRCQRNLIILGISAMFITLLFLLPTELLNKSDKQSALTSDDLAHYKDLGNILLDNRIEDITTKSLSNRPQGTEANPKTLQNAPEQNILPAPEPQHQPLTQQPAQQLGLPKNIESINENNIESNKEDVTREGSLENNRAEIELAIQDPNFLPGSKGVTIEEFLERMEVVNLPQKQHFHGARNERQVAVVNAFKHAWDNYRKYAWGHDNLKPISETFYDWFGLGLTIVDALDTMYIMGLEDEARHWISESLNFNINRDVNLFEVTIRVLGGLLSTYHLSGDKIFLQKSIELTNRLLPSFLTVSGIPYSDVNLATLAAHAPKWEPDSSTSEVTSLQMEFRDISRITNVSLYERVVQRVNERIHNLEKNNGLVPIFINADTGNFRKFATISLGARGDSYYEYLLKQWIQTGRKENDFLLTDYLTSIDGIFSKLLRRTPKDNHVYIGELIDGKNFKPKMDHLTCYLPGTLLLGHHFGLPDSHMLLARDLFDTCYQTYMKQPTKLAPEISYFAVGANEDLDIYVKPNDAHNLLRPEFIESLYYFYALTGNRTYQDMGWTIFQAFERHAKVTHGYTSIGNVKNVFNTRLRDLMETFWLGETLKYFYLLFSDNPKEIDLEKWVFNTEAHPLPIRKN